MSGVIRTVLEFVTSMYRRQRQRTDRWLRPVMTRFLGDSAGAAMIEFAISAMAVLLLVVGAIEIAMLFFAWSLMEYGVREAARFGFTGQGTEADRAQQIVDIVMDRSIGLVDIDVDDIQTSVFERFEDIDTPEPYTDSNGDGEYTSGEPFTDTNGNGTYDDGSGTPGLGGPSEIVLYQVRARWAAMTPFMASIFGERGVPLAASLVVQNEPWPEEPNP